MPRRRTIWTLIAGALLAVVLLVLFKSCGRSGASPRSAVTRSPEPKSQPAVAAEPSSRETVVVPPTIAPPTVVSPSAPPNTPQLRACDFTIDATGVRLARSTIASGRVKAPPRSVAARQIAFAAYDRSGRVVYQGEMDHPLWHEAEVEAADGSGRLQKHVRSLSDGVFQIRLPAEISVARLAFTEVLPDGTGHSARRALGEIVLPP